MEGDSGGKSAAGEGDLTIVDFSFELGEEVGLVDFDFGVVELLPQGDLDITAKSIDAL